MDWAGAVERNREALIAILEGLLAMLEEVGGLAARMSRPLHNAALQVLRPAESAVRRLIVVAAQGLVVKPAPVRPKPQGPIPHAATGPKAGRRPCFQLFDPRRRAPRKRRANPRILFFDHDPRVVALWPARKPAAPPDDGLVDSRRLRRRLEAVKLALEDLPRQARRLIRLQARREADPRLKYRLPVRYGRPPGRRKRPVHAVDHVLAECHALAQQAMGLDTS